MNPDDGWDRAIDESPDFVRKCVETILSLGMVVSFVGRQPPTWVYAVNRRRSWVSAKAEGFTEYFETAEEVLVSVGLYPRPRGPFRAFQRIRDRRNQ